MYIKTSNFHTLQSLGRPLVAKKSEYIQQWFYQEISCPRDKKAKNQAELGIAQELPSLQSPRQVQGYTNQKDNSLFQLYTDNP